MKNPPTLLSPPPPPNVHLYTRRLRRRGGGRLHGNAGRCVCAAARGPGAVTGRTHLNFKNFANPASRALPGCKLPLRTSRGLSLAARPPVLGCKAFVQILRAAPEGTAQPEPPAPEHSPEHTQQLQVCTGEHLITCHLNTHLTLQASGRLNSGAALCRIGTPQSEGESGGGAATRALVIRRTVTSPLCWRRGVARPFSI